jgi:L-asparaginase
MTSPLQPATSPFDNTSRPGRVVILGTGGTIAGTAASADQHHAYQSAQLTVQDLVAAVPTLSGVALEPEQVAQVDSKDMSVQVWVTLCKRIVHHLQRPGVAGVVVTHGTDTLEETAMFLHLALGSKVADRPVVLTAAMRPATSSQADGPQNLADAVAVARWREARGVLAVMAGQVWHGSDVRKVHGHRIDAFTGGDAPALARVSQGHPTALRSWPEPRSLIGSGEVAMPAHWDQPTYQPALWPWVEIVTSHAGAVDKGVRACVAAGVQGLVVAGTGNGSVHHTLEQALNDAQASGVVVWRTTRCVTGGWVSEDQEGCAWTPAQARVALQWHLMTQSEPA